MNKKVISLESLQRLVLSPLKAFIDQKVTKIDGKGLSTNDFTDAEKAKLAELNGEQEYRIALFPTEEGFVKDKTYAEMLEAYEAGKNLVIIDMSSGMSAPLAQAQEDNMVFTSPVPIEGNIVTLTVNNDDTIQADREAVIGSLNFTGAVEATFNGTGNVTVNIPEGVGGGAAIVDVTELPETDIREDVFYRVLTAEYWFNNTPATVYTCYVVETLPEVGEPATDVAMNKITSYYAIDTGENSGYLTEELGAAFGGLPAGWYPATSLFPAAGVNYGGIVTSIDEMQAADEMYLYLQEVVRYRSNGEWDSVQSIGRQGTGMAAEVFNTPKNVASGDYSHAEGWYTNANGRSTHVQGEYNIIETVKDEDKRGKYVHIVGNGTPEAGRSNAHTLDWNGNAWYQGDIYTGGTSQDDAERLAKVSEITAPRDHLALTDKVTGKVYEITIENGNLIATLVEGDE